MTQKSKAKALAVSFEGAVTDGLVKELKPYELMVVGIPRRYKKVIELECAGSAGHHEKHRYTVINHWPGWKGHVSRPNSKGEETNQYKWNRCTTCFRNVRTQVTDELDPNLASLYESFLAKQVARS